MMAPIKLPRRGRGRPGPEAEAAYQDALHHFCAAIREIASRLDFQVSSRGWCYILEEHGLGKGEFDHAQALIVQCRKDGKLPLDIVAVDDARKFEGLEEIGLGVEDEADSWVQYLERVHEEYTPFSFWNDQDFYVQILVEKIDLKGLFKPICSQFCIPIANSRGWGDVNGRADMMRRFAEWEAEGKQCVLLYCGDHDPGGLHISDFLHSNMAEISAAVGWAPDDVIIDRFGLNYDFIMDQGLTWIDNLETSSGKDLADPRNKEHHKAYVQDYIAEFGARKVEANALVVRPEAGRGLCLDAILKYIPEDAPEAYQEKLRPFRDELQAEVVRLLQERRS